MNGPGELFRGGRRLRFPYVGDGADGARRSAQIDLEEADGLDPGPRRDDCLLSAERWMLEAEEHDRIAAGSSRGTRERPEHGDYQPVDANAPIERYGEPVYPWAFIYCTEHGWTKLRPGRAALVRWQSAHGDHG